MLFEVHVTVDEFPTLLRANEFSDYVKDRHAAKTILIELERGSNPLQLMLADKTLVNNEEDAFAWAEAISDMTEEDGWEVCRVKLESGLTDGVTAYFEAHWKLNIVSDGQHQRVDEFVGRIPGFLRSRNLFDRRVHYLSRRLYECDATTARQSFDYHSNLLKEFGLSLDKYHYERVLWDSNPGLDEGWA